MSGWKGIKFIDIRNGETGVATNFISESSEAFLTIKFKNKTRTVVMNNVCISREHEIMTNEKIKDLFWRNKEGDWLPLADPHFVRDVKQLWINWAKLDAKIKNTDGFKEVVSVSEKRRQ